MLLTTDVLHGIKSLKYLNWLPEFESRIVKIRKAEFLQLILVKVMDAFMCVFYNMISVILFVVTIIGYVRRGNSVGNTNVFTLMALFGMLTEPLCDVPWAISGWLSSRVSYLRVMRLLTEKEIDTKNVGAVSSVDRDKAVIIERANFTFHSADETEEQKLKNKKMILNKKQIRDRSNEVSSGFKLGVRDL